jgi:hypothetical protein
VGRAGYPDPAVAASVLVHMRQGGGGGSGGGGGDGSGGGSGSGGGGGGGDWATAAEDDEACARLARHYLASAGYPHAGELRDVPARDGPSRPLLIALAWLVRRPLSSSTHAFPLDGVNHGQTQPGPAPLYIACPAYSFTRKRPLSTVVSLCAVGGGVCGRLLLMPPVGCIGSCEAVVRPPLLLL